MGFRLLASAAAAAACVLALAHDACGVGAELPMPVLLWSPLDVLAGKNVYLGLDAQGATHRDIASALLAATTNGTRGDAAALGLELVDLAGAAGQLQLVVVFLADELSVADVAHASQTGLKDAVVGAGSATSAVLPFTHVGARPGTQNAWSRWMGLHRRSFAVDASSASDMATLPATLAAKLAAADADAAAPAAAAPVAMVVSAGGDASKWGSVVADVTAAVGASAAAQQHAMLFTGLKHKREAAYPADSETLDLQLARRRLATVGLFKVEPIRSTPHIIFGMLLSLMLLFATLIYLCCMDSIQTPTVFATKYPPMGRVYD